MNIWLFIHLIFLGLWGGCVAVEMVMEFSSRNSSENKHRTAQLHYLIDLYVEAPILIMVLLSGVMLFNADNLVFPTYIVKVIAGLIPVIINILCIIPVFKRKFASDMNDEAAMEANTRLIFICFFTGLASALIALAAGMHILGFV